MALYKSVIIIIIIKSIVLYTATLHCAGSLVERNGLLRVGEEIVAVDSVDITHMSLDDVVILMSIRHH